jgi:Cu/Ag efflux pump CusA
MIDKILEFAVRQRVLVLMGALALLLVGLWSANKLPMDAIPDITGVQVQLNTTVPALAPDEVENLVTFPLETALPLWPFANHPAIHRQHRHLSRPPTRDRTLARRD